MYDRFILRKRMSLNKLSTHAVKLISSQTAGLCDIFDRQSFESRVFETFENPLDADPQWLSQLNLVFAVGFQMRNDRSIGNDNSSKILDRLERPGVNRAERFYLAARQLSDPAVDFEDGGIGVLQSLLLIILYMLASSKRSSAWGYLGALRHRCSSVLHQIADFSCRNGRQSFICAWYSQRGDIAYV